MCGENWDRKLDVSLVELVGVGVGVEAQLWTKMWAIFSLRVRMGVGGLVGEEEMEEGRAVCLVSYSVFFLFFFFVSL